jgi:hypothetical protein
VRYKSTASSLETFTGKMSRDFSGGVSLYLYRKNKLALKNRAGTGAPAVTADRIGTSFTEIPPMFQAHYDSLVAAGVPAEVANEAARALALRGMGRPLTFAQLAAINEAQGYLWAAS